MLFFSHLYSTWMSLKERYIIPKRKEPEQSPNYHYYRHRHYHHRHYSPKHSHKDYNHRFNFSIRSSTAQQKSIDRSHHDRRRSPIPRDTQEQQQLSKDERRKLFEQQYEDEEKVIDVVFLSCNKQWNF